MRASAHNARAPDPGAVLTKATLRAAELLELTDAQLARIIGVSGASVSRLRASARAIDPGAKEGELALTFLRMYRSLNALLGDAASCRAWFHAENDHLGGTPALLVRSVEGLVNVTQYLDAMRGKV
ncbi:antitoxin Xre/MbcA/ParS toxin-binding domain-containing protein [Anaeromyxobacter terrae]|uniref:antitoxin Xre/MbcA/ParS toxin-binding domain-containing protein n=1 Tax=Anaeromyxobacter terrae TaxID=2925406 RepID=UPI001F58E693|nr:MbcA/ParS/Xre antitoxin family protein [Anaeromyxobacter sp. SG22]